MLKLKSFCAPVLSLKREKETKGINNKKWEKNYWMLHVCVQILEILKVLVLSDGLDLNTRFKNLQIWNIKLKRKII